MLRNRRLSLTLATGWALSTAAAPAAWASKADWLREAPKTPEFTQEEIKDAQEFPEQFTIQKVVIEDLGPAKPQTAPATQTVAPPAKEGVDINDIINIFNRIIDIIKANTAVINISKDYYAAVPKGVDHWEQLLGWKLPEGRIYGFKAVNGFGGTSVEVKYQVLRTWGGSYVGDDGVARGKFLSGVTVEPLSVKVGWGYRLDFTAKAPTTINVGTSKDQPIAGMQVNLDWDISTMVKKEHGTAVYFVQGDGAFRQVAGPFGVVATGAATAIRSADSSPAGLEKVRYDVDRMGATIEKVRVLSAPGAQRLFQ